MIYEILDLILPIAIVVSELSIKSSLLVLFIIFLRTIFRYKLPPHWHYVFWFLIVFRLLLPFDMTTHHSVFSQISINNSYVNNYDEIANTKIPKPGIDPHEIAKSYVNFGLDNQQHINHDKNFISWVHILVLIWISGMIVFSIFVYRANRKVLKTIKSIKPVKDKRLNKLLLYCKNKMHITSTVRLCELKDIKIPFIIGLIKPLIIIPANTNNCLKLKQYYHIFLHELAHYKRYDIVIAWITTILIIIHWFNPIIWFAFYLMRIDREIACDGFALKYIKQERNKEYGKSILSLIKSASSTYRMPLTVNFINNKFELKRRLKLLTGKNNIKMKWRILFILMFLSITLLSFTKYVPVLQGEEKIIDLSIYTVGIDPAHGGKDLGFNGISGIKEKDLTLSISKKLYKELIKTGLNVFQLRENDIFIPLKKRTTILDSVGSDIAISIHCNGHKGRAKKGIETYYKKHNKESKFLDSLLHTHLNSNTNFDDRGSATAPFWILKGTNITSVMIETGYISNEDDLRKLKNEAVQEKIAFAIKEAVIEYFQYIQKVDY